MIKRKVCLVLSLWVLFLYPYGLSFAESGTFTGAEIIEQSNALVHKVQDQKNTVTLFLIERDGATKKIVAYRYWKNYSGEGGIVSKMLLMTQFPLDSRGVAFLIWDYSRQDKMDDLWLYLPALRMVRRISGQDLNDAFLGSDLTFGDMGQRRLDEDEHFLLKEEDYRGTRCYVVESFPREKESIYSKKVAWVSKRDWTILKIDYYDQGSSLLKRQTINWQEVEGYDVWRKTVVVNIQNGHRTTFEVSDLEVNVGLQDRDFSERALRRGLKRLER